MTLWSILDAPLVFGGDMTQLDDFTLNLLTNDEVIAVNQDVLGKQAVPVSKSGNLEVWVNRSKMVQKQSGSLIAGRGWRRYV